MFKEIKEPISRHPYLDLTRRKQIRYSVTDIIDARGVYLTLGDQEGRLIEAFKRDAVIFITATSSKKHIMLSEKIKENL